MLNSSTELHNSFRSAKKRKGDHLHNPCHLTNTLIPTGHYSSPSFYGSPHTPHTPPHHHQHYHHHAHLHGVDVTTTTGLPQDGNLLCGEASLPPLSMGSMPCSSLLPISGSATHLEPLEPPVGCLMSQVSLEPPQAAADWNLLRDQRVLDNMLMLEQTTRASDGYLTRRGSDIQPRMRSIVTRWMLEVCDEQHCENQVFLVAVNLLDRFLNTTSVKRTQLQLCACVCLLLASKLRQCNFLSVELLVFYTDNCVTQEEVRQWEVLVVAKLRWDLCPVTAIDFVEVLLQRLPAVGDPRRVRRHTATLIALAATEWEFICHLPSTIAGAAVVASIQGLTHASAESLAPCLETVASTLDAAPHSIQLLLVALEESIKRASGEGGGGSSSGDGSSGGGDGGQEGSVTGSKHQQEYSKLRAMMEGEEDFSVDSDGKETPVDVMDVHF